MVRKLLRINNNIPAFILAFLYTAMQLVGWQISMHFETSVHSSSFFQKIGELSTWQCLLAGSVELIFWYVIISLGFRLLEKHAYDNIRAEKTDSGSAASKFHGFYFYIIAILLFVCWIPLLVACFPGFYTYDGETQLAQALYPEVAYNTHHPLLHTLFMGKIIALGYHCSGGQLWVGILMHSLIQMILCAVAFSCIICWIWKISGKKWLVIVSFLYYAFFPTITLFVLSTTKDVLFGILLQLTMLLLYEIYHDGEETPVRKRKILVLIFCGSFMCLFRNNGIYAVILMVIIAFFLFPKERKRTVLIFGAVLLFYLISDKSLQTLLHAEKTNAKEAFSVPIQQIARVYNEIGETAFEPDELELLYQAAPPSVLSLYSPFISDNVKYELDFNVVLANKTAFLKLWLRCGVNYPKEYIISFLENTYQAWYPGTSIERYPSEGRFDYFEIEGFNTVTHWHGIPWLYDFYYKISRGFYYQKVPVLRLLFSIGAMFWVLLFMLFYGFRQKDNGIKSALLLVLCYCFTCFFGPVSLVRYYLILFFEFPVCGAFLCCGNPVNKTGIPIFS